MYIILRNTECDSAQNTYLLKKENYIILSSVIEKLLYQKYTIFSPKYYYIYYK